MSPTQQAETLQPANAQSVWEVDPAHTTVEFAVKHLMIATVRGRFRAFRGAVHLDEADPSRSRVEGQIEVASVDTGASDRDDHLRSPDFFDAATFPTIAFRSVAVESAGPDRALVRGDLTIRGITLPITLDVTHEGTTRDPWGNTRAGFTATSSLDRRSFGLTWNQGLEAGGWLVGDRVKIELAIEAVRKPAGNA